MASQRICSVDGCDKPHCAQGYCRAHYKRLKRYGNALGGSTQRGAAQRYFREVVVPYDGTECLIWPFARNAGGYAVIKASAGATMLASRRICEAAYGAPPSDAHEAAHSCGNGANGCVAKRHLGWATSTENKADMLQHGTRMRGGKHVMARLSEADVIAIRERRGKATLKEIASTFGVSAATVSQIQNRRSWSWL